MPCVKQFHPKVENLVDSGGAILNFTIIDIVCCMVLPYTLARDYILSFPRNVRGTERRRRRQDRPRSDLQVQETTAQ